MRTVHGIAGLGFSLALGLSWSGCSEAPEDATETGRDAPTAGAGAGARAGEESGTRRDGDGTTAGADGGPLALVTIHAGATALCPGACTDLTAEAAHGLAPYAYAWDQGVGDGPGPHEICPSATTTYAVVAHDTAIESAEFSRESMQAEASVTVRVSDSDAGVGCTGDDGGAFPPPTTTELCSLSIAYDDGSAGVPLRLAATRSLTTDAEGNLYVALGYRGRIDFGGGASDGQGVSYGYLAKYDPSCRPAWSRSFGGVGAEVSIDAVASGPSSEVVVGGMLDRAIQIDGQPLLALRPSPLVLSFDGSDGSLLWGEVYASSNGDGEIYQLGVDGVGDIVFSGIAGGDLDVAGHVVSGPDGAMRFLAKVSSQGEFRFGYELVNTDLISRLAVHADGTIALTSLAYGVDDVGLGPDMLPIDVERMRRFVALLDPDGGLSWGQVLDRDLPDPNPTAAGGVAIDRDGNVFVEHGDYSGSSDQPATPELVSKLDARGTLLWSKDVAPAHWHAAFDFQGDLAVDSQGNLLHTDVIDDALDPKDPDLSKEPTDVAVQKLSANGAPRWEHVLSVDTFDETWSMAVGPDDSVWIGHGRSVGLTPHAGELLVTKLAP